MNRVDAAQAFKYCSLFIAYMQGLKTKMNDLRAHMQTVGMNDEEFWNEMNETLAEVDAAVTDRFENFMDDDEEKDERRSTCVIYRNK